MNQTETKKLIIALDKAGIEFEIQALWNGIQVRTKTWDAVCHDYSYGHERGLLEVMGLPQCQDDVIGWLTADEVMGMLAEVEHPMED